MKNSLSLLLFAVLVSHLELTQAWSRLNGKLFNGYPAEDVSSDQIPSQPSKQFAPVGQGLFPEPVNQQSGGNPLEKLNYLEYLRYMQNLKKLKYLGMPSMSPEMILGQSNNLNRPSIKLPFISPYDRLFKFIKLRKKCDSVCQLMKSMKSFRTLKRLERNIPRWWKP